MSLYKILIAGVVLGGALTSAEPVELPTAGPAVIELHGEFLQPGQEAPAPFWMRIKVGDQAYAGHRLAELVYTAPTPATIAGTVLVDHPYLLLDDHLRLMAWNGREGLAKVTALKAGGYQVVREITLGEGIAALGRESVRTITDGLAWDQRLAPLMLAACWTSGSNGRVPTVDFYGEAPASEVTWADQTLQLGGWPARVEADAHGRCARIVGQDGRVWITITATHPDGP